MQKKIFSRLNFSFDGNITTQHFDGVYVKFGTNSVKLPESKVKKIIDESYFEKDIILGIRPEDIHEEQVFIENYPDTVVTATVDIVENLGHETLMYLSISGKEETSVARVDARSTTGEGETIKVSFDANRIHLFDKETESTILKR